MAGPRDTSFKASRNAYEDRIASERVALTANVTGVHIATESAEHRGDTRT
jgi:hypothetical protein